MQHWEISCYTTAVLLFWISLVKQNKQLIEIFGSFCTQYVSTFVKIKYIFSNYSTLQAFLESGVRPMILNTKLSSALGSSPGEKSLELGT